MGQQSAKVTNCGHRTKDFIIKDDQLRPGQRCNMSVSLEAVPHNIEKQRIFASAARAPNRKQQGLTSDLESCMTDFYDANASAFISTTRDVDMSDMQRRFLAALPIVEGKPARILDAGSGSGRDALAFRLLGYEVEAFDASPAMVAATREHAGVQARQMRFEDFAWDHPFEGIWACASLLHVAAADLPAVIKRLAAHLTQGGALYLSFKLGTGERVKDGRQFTDRTEDSLATLVKGCGVLSQPDIWQSRDCRPDRASEMWINAVVTKR
jgi:SAM-dependent methyltransferase